jgi:hypothetical protein
LSVYEVFEGMNTRTTIILLVVAIALGAGMLMLFNQEQKDAQQPVAAAAGQAKDLFEPKPASLVQLRVEQTDRPTRLFELRQDEWVIVEPVKARAARDVIEGDARAIADLQYIQKYEPGAAEMPSDNLTGLKKPELVLTIKDKDGAAHTVRVGNVRPMSEDETYITKDNDPAVYVVKVNLLGKFVGPLGEYRERRVANIPFNEVARVQVAGAQNYELVKAGEDWILEQPVRGRTDRAKVDALLQAACNVYTENYVADDDTNLRIFGLAQPQLQIAITTEKKQPATQAASTQSADSQPAATQPAEIKTTTLLVGAKANNQYFAKLADETSVFQISDAIFKAISVPLLDIRDKSIAQVDQFKVKGLDLTVNGQSVMLAKANDRWQMAGAFVGPAESAAVSDLVKAISEAKATAFEDDPKPQLTEYGFENPRARIRIVSEGEVDPVEILVGANTPSGEMTFVRNASNGTIAVLKKTEADALVIEPSAMLERSVFSFSRENAEKIEIAQEGRTTTLVRHGDTWRMIEPADADADREAVNAILSDLSALRAQRVVAVSQDEKYGLANPPLTVKVTVKDSAAASQPAVVQASVTGDATATQPAATQPTATQPAEKVHTLLVSHNPTGTYARLAEGTWIYEIDPVVNSHLTAELHDRAVLKIDPEQAASIKVPTDGGEALEFTKKGDKWTYTADPFVQIDAAKVKEWLGLLNGTRADRFVAYNMQNPADFGLDKPLYEVEVTQASGQTMKLLVARPTESGKHVATVAGTTTAFELPAGSVMQLQKPLAFFKG